MKVGVTASSAGIRRHHQISKGTGEYFEPKSHYPPGRARQKAAIYLTYHHHTPPHPHHPLHPHQEQNNYHHFWMKLYELINFLHTKKFLNHQWKSLKNVTFSCPFWIFYVMYKKFLSFSSSNLWALLYSNLSLLTVSFPDSTSAQWGQWSGNKTVGQEHLVLVASFPCRLSRDMNMYCGDRVYISMPVQLQGSCSWAWEPGSEAMVFVYCKQSNSMSLVWLRWRDTIVVAVKS